MNDLKHFEPQEFRCRCGKCSRGFIDMQNDLLARLDHARELAGVPFVLTSAVRCPEWNVKVGGVDSSAHIDGYAVDIAAPSGRRRFEIFQALIKAGFNRIGVASKFIHVDCDPDKPPKVIWTY